MNCIIFTGDKMNDRLKKIIINPIRNYRNLLTKFNDGIDLTVGEGHFESSSNTKLKGVEALIKNDTKYSEINGNELLRKKLIEKYYPAYSYQDEIIITNGSTQGLYSILLSLLNEDDEVILISPYYPTYKYIVNLLGYKAVIVDTKDSDFKIKPYLIKDVITNKSKAIIINEPSNPAGITYSYQEKKELIKFFADKDIYIIVDELYRSYTSDDFVSFSDIIKKEENKLKNQFIFLNGLSKSHLMTGYRVGYVISNKIINSYLKKINYLNISCVSIIMQKCALGALEDDDYYQNVKNYYLNNIKIVKKVLLDLHIDFADSTGGYYIFMNVEKFNLIGEVFCKLFLDYSQIALVPGYIFGEKHQDYVRISCCRDVKEIVQFVCYLTKFNNSLLNNSK